MKRLLAHAAAGALALLLGALPLHSQQRFSELVGPVSVGEVKRASSISVPFILWGGDVATFHANGGLKTGRRSIFGELGLSLELVQSDDFVGQVRRYLAGETPFLRGTFRMLGQASEVIGRDPRTQPVVFLQMTWSAGDHMIARSHIKTIDRLKGARIALQRGGPHVGMLDDVLRTAGLQWSDVSTVWTDELTGKGSPPDLLRSDSTVDACFAITPDMFGLTGGLEGEGSGAEGTVKGARVLVSTANMKRSIADVYAVRKDYYDANRETVENFAAGYLKASEQVLEMKAAFEKTGSSPGYMKLLKTTQTIFGADVIPTLEVDAHGLVADCRFVGMPGNVAFFREKGNLDGFAGKQRIALDLAVSQGYAGSRTELLAHNLDYDKLARVGGLTKTQVARPRAAEITSFDGEDVDDKTIYSFTITFEPNQQSFSSTEYGQHFQRALEQASLFGNSIVAIRGHSDPTLTLRELVRAGTAKGILKRSGSPGNYRYFFEGRPLDLSDTARIVELIETGGFTTAQANPRATMQAALNLSRTRAEAVRDALVEYARLKGIALNENQFRPEGTGINEPLIAKPRNLSEAKQNMRVEFRLIKEAAEAVDPGAFDF